MSVTAADVIRICPEFELVDEDRIEEFISKAERRTCRTQWGEKADDAVILLTAHLLKLNSLGSGGSAGPVQAEKVGSISRTYFVTSAQSNSLFSTTSYGRQYQELLETIFSDRVF